MVRKDFSNLIGKKVVPTFKALEGDFEGAVSSLLSVDDAGVFLDSGMMESRFVTYPAIGNMRLATEQEKQERDKDIKEFIGTDLKKYLEATHFDSFEELVGRQVCITKEHWKKPGSKLDVLGYVGKVMEVDGKGIKVNVEKGRVLAGTSWEPARGTLFFPFATPFYVDKEDEGAAKKYLKLGMGSCAVG